MMEQMNNITKTWIKLFLMLMWWTCLLIIIEVKYGAIDTDDSSCYGCFIIKFSSSPNTLQANLIIGGQVISSSEIVYEGNYFFPININSRYYVLQRNKSINIIYYLRKIINFNVKVICYDCNDVVPQWLRSVS